MAKLARAVHVRDPKSGRRLVLAPGEEPAAHLAALILSPSAWENGELPTATDTSDSPADAGTSGDGETKDDTKAAPAAKKPAAKRAATKPARGRDAAAEGTSGD